ncbi:hypothetical protein DPMN_184609 [Dreissena polymorpha]|uniref:Uncharacterized protein n=1 Tax=Dreissena polymorpha TaxID=45954 RepID=A0A9D4DJK6_DREPO|nr:hypothetical protein DPMN_184609 [Dreissena polymorpha]
MALSTMNLDFAFKNLNTTIRPVFADPEKTLNIMFTHTGIPAKYSDFLLIKRKNMFHLTLSQLKQR